MIVSVKHCLKELDVQSGPCGDLMQKGTEEVKSVIFLPVG